MIIITEETKVKGARQREDLEEAKAVILQTVRDQRAARLRKAAILATTITTEMIIITEMITMETIIIMEETKVKEAKQRKEVMFGFHNDIPMVIPTAIILQTVRDQRAARLRKAAILAMTITTETIIIT